MRQNGRALSTLKPGESSVITHLETEPAVTLHLVELGLAPGERITLLRTAPWGGPVEVELMGYRLAIRRSEADKIVVCSREDL